MPYTRPDPLVGDEVHPFKGGRIPLVRCIRGGGAARPGSILTWEFKIFNWILNLFEKSIFYNVSNKLDGKGNMEKSYDLCTGRDARGRVWMTRVPGGLVRTGMFVRLLGGVFILIERVEQNGRTTAPLCAAMQVLDSVWEGRGRE